MSYTTDYTGLSNMERQSRALADVLHYLGEERMRKLVKHIRDPNMTIGELNVVCGFAGLKGAPFHALMREYRLTDYRAWMHDPSDPILTDEDGFII